MSTTIDQRVVEMQFDNRQFETNVKTSLSTLDRLKQSLNLNGASKGLENVSSAAKKVDMSGLSGAVQTVQAKFSTFEVMAVTALANITNTAVNAGKRIVSSLTIDPIKLGFQEYETQINAIQTILANTSSKGTTLDQVGYALDELNAYADRTIYNFTEMTRNIGTFTAAGVDLDTSVSAIKGIANLAAVSGSTSQQASTAMYQLSQALSSGTVKLMDWNSVVNAGMGGQVFKDALSDTARVHGIAIDDMIEDEGSFRETLRNGWLTSDILTETLAKFTGDLNEDQLRTMGYADEQIQAIVKMGQTANGAATEVKTFTQLFDTLKEAAQSGWTESWEIIIGDFGEAKELLTEMSDTFGGMLGESSNARNEVLLGGLASGWKQLLKQGIADSAGYEDAIKEVAKSHGVVLDDMINDNVSFQDALSETLKDGRLTSETLTEALSTLTSKTAGLSDEQLKERGYTRAQIDSLESLNESVQNGTISMDEFAKKMMRTSGRENLIEALRNSLNGVLSIIKPVTEAFKEIFPPMTGEQLYKITENIKNLTASFKLSKTPSDDLKSTFKGLFAVLDIVKQAVLAVFNAVGPLLGGFGDLGGGILGVTANFGEWLVGVDEAVKKSDIFNNVLQGIIEFVKQTIDAVKNLVDKIKEKIDFNGFDLFHSFLERVHERMSQVGDAAGEMKSGVVVAIELMGEALANSKFLKLLQVLWDGVKTIAGGIANALGIMTEGVVDKISNADFNGIFDLINTAALSGIAIAITKFLKGVTDPLNGIMDILNSVRGCFEAYQASLNAGTLLKIASAIAILTASILVISLIDSDKLTASLAAITVLFADLMASMAIYNKIGGSYKNTVKASISMIAMSVAISILAGAMKKVAELDWEDIAKGLVGIAGMTAIVVAFAKVMSTNKRQIIKGATSLVIFAVAIKILASVCKDLSTLSWDELTKGLVGVGVLMAAVSLFLNTAKFSGKTIMTATGIVILAAAIKILASACKDFGEMKWEDLAKGLSSIGALLLEITIFTKLTGNAKNVISTGIALIAIAAAMKIFASAAKDFGEMKWEDLGKALAGMAGALAAVTLAVNFMPKNMVGIGIGLIAVSTALIIMASALDRMGDMSWEEIARGLTVLGGSMAILAIGLNVMNGTLAGSAAMLVAVAALAVLAPVLSILGAMSWESIAKGLVAIAGAFAVLGIAGLVLTPLVPAILSLAGSFALIGLSVLGIGVGLWAVGAGLSAVAIGFAALATAGAAGATAIVASLTIIITGIASLIPAVVAKIGEAIIEVCKVIAEGAPAIGEAIKALVLTLVDVLVECVPAIVEGALILLVEVLEALVEYTPRIVDAILQFLIAVLDGVARNLPGLTKAVVDVIMALFSGVIDALKSIDVDILIQGIAGIGLLSAIMVALGAIALLTPVAMVGVLGMGVVIAELALVLAAIGALAQIPGLTWLVNEGAKLMEGIGNAIGSFIGGIVGGFMSGVSSQFPKIGTDLSAFMTNIQPFIEGAKAINPSVLDGVNALAGTIIILTAANILDGLTSWFTGGSSLSKFAEELVPFGKAMKEFSIEVAGMDGNLVANAATAGKTLAEMASTLPKSGGVVGFFAGEGDMTEFSAQLVPFGKAMKDFSLVVSGIDGEAVANAATAGKAMAEMAGTIPNTGGVVEFFTGSNDMEAFSGQLIPFGKAIKAFSLEVQGLDVEAITNSATAGKSLSELANNLPNNGGVVAWFTGGNDMLSFGDQLVPFGKAMKEYSVAVSGLDVNAISNSTTAGKAISELADNLPNQGGMVSWFTGENDMSSFGENLISFGRNFSQYSDYMKNVDSGVVTATVSAAKSIINLQDSLPQNGWFDDKTPLATFGKDMASFGSYFSSYYGYISGINTYKLNNVTSETNGLVSMAKGMSNLDTSGMSNFGRSLQTLGQIGVDGFISAFNDSRSKVTQTASDMLTTFVDGANAKKYSLTSTFTSLIQEIINAMNDKKNQFSDTAQSLMTGFINGVKSKKSEVSNALVRIVGEALSDIKNRNKYNDFYNAGVYLVDGFAAGITANTYKAKAKSKAMAQAALNAAERALNINSPSKEFFKVGDFAGMGFVNALDDYGSKSYDAGYDMADSARDGLGKAIAKIRDVVTGDIDSSPTIKPVMDLSNIQNGANQLYRMMDGVNGYAVSGSVNMANQTANRMSRRTSKNNDDPTSAAIDGLNKVVNELASNPAKTFENTFNISGNNPKEIAEEVSRIIQRQVERRETSWA